MKSIQVDDDVHAWLKKNREDKSISELIKSLIEKHKQDYEKKHSETQELKEAVDKLTDAVLKPRIS